MTDSYLELEDGSVEIIVSAPFRTGIILDSSELLEKEIEKDIKEKLIGVCEHCQKAAIKTMEKLLKKEKRLLDKDKNCNCIEKLKKCFEEKPVKGYECWQEAAIKIMEELLKNEEGTLDRDKFSFNTPRRENQSAGKGEATIDVLGDERGEMLIPRYFLSCKIKEKEDKFFEDNGESDNSEGFKLKILSTRVRFYEFGLGTIVFSLKLEHESKKVCMEKLKKFVEKICSAKNFGEQLDGEISLIIGHYESMVKELKIPNNSLLLNTPDRNKDVKDETTLTPEWTHRLFCITTELGEGEEEKIEKATMLLRQNCKENLDLLKGSVDGCKMHFYAGEGNSVLICAQKENNKKISKCVSRVLVAMGVYSAINYDLRNKLFLVTTGLVGKEKDLKGIGESGKKIVNYMQFASHVASHVNQYKFSLEPFSRNIQKKIDTAWDFTNWHEGLEKDTKQLEAIYDRRLNDAFGLRQERLNLILLIFTFTSIPFLIISYDLSYGREFFVAVPMLAGALAIYLFWYHENLDKPKAWCRKKWEELTSKFKKNKQKNAAKN